MWRDIFTSCSSLWTEFDCENADKTRVYLDRSKSSPIGLWIWRNGDLSPDDPFFQVIPYAIHRLKSLVIHGSPEDLTEAAAQLSHPAPLLESLTVKSGSEHNPQWSQRIPTILFNGDLSSLRKLRLEWIRTELPWRNMINLTSFTLRRMTYGDLSVCNILDFFESAPNLCNIELYSITPTSGVQKGRLVLLGHLKRMVIEGGPPSLLLDYLLIPAGAELTSTGGDLFGTDFEDLLPESFDNLGNLSDFTEIRLYVYGTLPRLQFSGPNGKLCLVPATLLFDTTIPALSSLAEFDTSKTERLEIVGGRSKFEDYLYQALLPMENLRVLTLSRCEDISSFAQALRPRMGSSEVMVCPKLEELVLVPSTEGEVFNIGDVVDVVTARASRGAKLRTVRMVGRWGLDERDVSGLKKHILSVEFSPGVRAEGDDGYYGDSGDESDDDSGDKSDDDSSGGSNDGGESGDCGDEDGDDNNEED